MEKLLNEQLAGLKPIAKVLEAKRRLLPLLEAAEAMRGTIEMECSGEDPDGCDKRWDAALCAAQEQP